MRITMITKMAGLFFLLTILLAGCSVGKNTYSPDRKFSLKQVEKDYSLYQSILEGLKAKDSDRIRQRKEELEQELVEAEKGMKYYAV